MADPTTSKSILNVSSPEDLLENTLAAIWFIPDDIMEKETKDGNYRVWLKGRYQAENGGVPKKVVHVWGLNAKDMRKIMKYKAEKPFTMISIVGDLDTDKTTTLSTGQAGNPIHSVSNSFIELDEEGNWVTETLRKEDIIVRQYAKGITREEMSQRRQARQPAVIDTDNRPRSQSQREAFNSSDSTAETETESKSGQLSM